MLYRWEARLDERLGAIIGREESREAPISAVELCAALLLFAAFSAAVVFRFDRRRRRYVLDIAQPFDCSILLVALLTLSKNSMLIGIVQLCFAEVFLRLV